MQPEEGQDIGQGRTGVQEENQGGHQNTPREAWTEQGHQPGHPSCHPLTGVTWSRRVMWHQLPLLTIPWRRQRDSAENSGTFSTIILTLCTECLISNKKMSHLSELFVARFTFVRLAVCVDRLVLSQGHVAWETLITYVTLKCLDAWNKFEQHIRYTKLLDKSSHIIFSVANSKSKCYNMVQQSVFSSETCKENIILVFLKKKTLHIRLFKVIYIDCW